jgi:Dullard-like phosphatase family protein
LVHAKFTETVQQKSDLFFEIFLNSTRLPWHLYVRPGARDFIIELSKYFELVVFTASKPAYATKVVEFIDPGNLIAHVLYRDSWVEHNIPNYDSNKSSFWVKDLSRLSRFIDDVILIDNSPSAYIYQKENGMPIVSWTGQLDDIELYLYLNIFKMISKFNIDLKYALLNIVKEDRSIDHDKFAQIVDSWIYKTEFAKKTADYRKAHELSFSPNKAPSVRLLNTIGDSDYMQTYQIQTECIRFKDSDTDSSGSENFSRLNTINMNLCPNNKWKSDVLRKFEDSSPNKNATNQNMINGFMEKRRLKKVRSSKPSVTQKYRVKVSKL